MSWQPIVVLPNITTRCAIEGTSVALVSAVDERVANLRTRHATLDRFLDNFHDAFRRPQEVSVLLLRTQASETYRSAGAISGFRDLVAMSVIPCNRASLLWYGRTVHSPLFSNSFSFYPWMLDRNAEDLIAMTPAMLALDEVAEFSGQVSPEISTQVLDSLDEPLLQELIRRWEIRYSGAHVEWSNAALFRSLNMAFHAAQTPFITAGTTFDTGRLVALWVSAFEILAHPGPEGRSDKFQVWGVLAGRVSAETFRGQRGQRPWVTTLREAVYEHMYNARNAYLHGNQVEDGGLVLPNAAADLSMYAAVLYRLMLTEFLELVPRWDDIPSHGQGFTDAMSSAVVRHAELDGPIRQCERALRTIGGYRRQVRVTSRRPAASQT